MTELPGSLSHSVSYQDAPQAIFGLIVGLAVSIVIWVLIALAIMFAYA